MSSRQPAVFLDRDGTLIVDVGYPNDPALVELAPGAATAMRSLNALKIPLIVVSNQSGIARGKISPEQARQVHERFVEVFRDVGVEFTGLYYCPHAPEDNCECRKPKPGMLLRAAAEYNLDLTRSVMVGDRMGDIEAGRRAGCRSILFRSQYVDDTVGQAASLSSTSTDASLSSTSTDASLSSTSTDASLSLPDHVVSHWDEAVPILIEMMKRNDA